MFQPQAFNSQITFTKWGITTTSSNNSPIACQIPPFRLISQDYVIIRWATPLKFVVLWLCVTFGQIFTYWNGICFIPLLQLHRLLIFESFSLLMVCLFMRLRNESRQWELLIVFRIENEISVGSTNFGIGGLGKRMKNENE